MIHNLEYELGEISFLIDGDMGDFAFNHDCFLKFEFYAVGANLRKKPLKKY